MVSLTGIRKLYCAWLKKVGLLRKEEGEKLS